MSHDHLRVFLPPRRRARGHAPAAARGLLALAGGLLLAVAAATPLTAPRPVRADEVAATTGAVEPDRTDPSGGPITLDPWSWDHGGEPDDGTTCTLRLCCALVDAVVVEGWHCWTTCTRTDADGTETTTACRAGPTGLFRDLGHGELPPCRNWTIFDGAWGPIDTYCGPFDETHPDHGLPATECIVVRTPAGGCTTCGCVAETFERIEDCCVRFELLPELYGFNDNSAAATALHECGVLGPLASLARANPEWGSPLLHLLKSVPQFPAEPLDFGTPGWGTLIPLDCDE